jgi:D-glycero-alpha-D-manno-heptose-7-phosphate kinase
MIISRTPLRMSLVGGGSDLPGFYRRHGGAVVSTTINQYVYVNVNKKFDSGIRVAYSKTEEVTSVDMIEHRIVKCAMQVLNLAGGVEITTISDIPSRGTGLGSSSSFAVGLLNALAAFQGRHMSSDDLGSLSCRIEIDLCRDPIGKQDQYAAAFGGFNLIEFRPDDSVLVSPIIMSSYARTELEKRFLVFYTGMTRSASDILTEQARVTAEDGSKQDALKRMVQLTYRLRDELQQGNVASVGEILDQNWKLKTSLASNVTTEQVDDWYRAAKKSGAIGGKLLGAGGGGFMLLYADEDRHEAIKHALPLRCMSFKFEPLGSRIIFYNP